MLMNGFCIYHYPCPPAHNLGSLVSGLVFQNGLDAVSSVLSLGHQNCHQFQHSHYLAPAFYCCLSCSYVLFVIFFYRNHNVILYSVLLFSYCTHHSIISQFSAAGEELEKYHKSLTKSAREKDKLIKTSSKERMTAIKVAQDKEAAFVRRSKEKEDAKNQETEIGEGGWN